MNPAVVTRLVQTLCDEPKEGMDEVNFTWSVADEIAKVAPRATDCLLRLMELLEDSKPHVKWSAAFFLGWMGPAGAPAIPVLGKLVMGQAQPEWLRKKVISVLCQIGPDAVPVLVNALKASDRVVRKTVAFDLGLFPVVAAHAVPALIDAFQDPDREVRSDACSALKEVGAGATSALEHALSATNPLVRVFAARTLLENNPMCLPAIEAAVAAFSDPIADVRKAAATALFDRAGAHPHLTATDYGRLLKDSNAYVRSFAGAALANLDAMDAAPAFEDLVSALDDEDYSVRNRAIDTFGNFGAAASRVVPKLIELLTDPANTHNAVQALGNVGPEASAALPALRSLKESMKEWDQEDPEVVQLEEALQEATLQILGQRPRTEYVPMYKAAVPTLIGAIKGDDQLVSIRALFALVQRGVEALPALVGLLADTDPAVRATALSGLRELKSEAAAAVPALIGGLADQESYGNRRMNELYALTLATIGGPGIVALTEATVDPNPVVQEAARKALGV